MNVIDNCLYSHWLFLIVTFNTWYYLYFCFIYLEKKTYLEI